MFTENMKILVITLLLIPNYETTTILSVIEEINQLEGNVSEANCLANYVKKRFTRKGVIIISDDIDYGLDQENMKEILLYITKYLMESKKLSIERRTCQRRRICTSIQITQYLIYAKSPHHLHSIINRCICSHMSSQTPIIIAPSTVDYEAMVKVIERHSSLQKAVVVTRAGSDIRLYFERYHCPGSESAEDTEKVKPMLYSCSSKTKLLPASNQLDCQNDRINKNKLRFGIRHTPFYAFPHNNVLLGVETVIMTVLLGMTFEDLQKGLWRVDYGLGEYNVTSQEGYGLVKDLHDRKIDVILGALNYYENDFDFDTSYPLFYSTLHAIVRKKKNHNIFFILRIFQWRVWVTVMSIGTLLIILYKLKSKKNITGPDTTFSIIYKFITILLGKDVTIKRKHFKFILLSWILISFFLRSSMEAMLIKILANRDKYNQIDSLSEICNEGYKIFVSEINYHSFKNGLNLHDCFIPPENFLLVEKPLQNVLLADSAKVAAFMYKGVYDFDKWYYAVNLDGKDLPFHVVKERINNLPFVYFYNRGEDALSLRFRNNALRLSESGIVRHEEVTSQFYMMMFNIHLLRPESNLCGIKISHVEAVFYIYMFGCLLALITFIIEIAYHKLCKTKQLSEH